MKVFTDKKKEEETHGYNAPEPLFFISELIVMKQQVKPALLTCRQLAI